jgi:PE family
VSFVNVTPEVLTTAATNLADIGSTISGANAAAAGPTTASLAAAADGVSAAVAAVFNTHAETYQSLSAQIAAFHEDFVKTLTSGAGAYAAQEAANAAPIRDLLGG